MVWDFLWVYIIKIDMNQQSFDMQNFNLNPNMQFPNDPNMMYYPGMYPPNQNN